MELIKRLTQCNSPSGREENIRKIIIEEVKDYCDDIRTDALGNLIVRKGKGGKKLLLSAHMDEIGVVVTYKDDKGFLRFAPVGGLSDVVGRRVVFENGVCGVIGKERGAKDNEYSKMYIDTGNRGDISVGDMACFCGEFKNDGDIVISKALDDRIGCYVLIEALKSFKGENELICVFTVQEEVGLRGAKAAGFGIDADMAIVVDVTDTGDTPECSPMAVKMGAGAAVKVMDRSIICHADVRNALINVANSAQIPYQLEIMTEGGTDAGALHTSGNGIKTGGISIPARYIHSPSEMIDLSDVKSAIKLIGYFCNDKSVQT